jgi:predicted nucleic acid-binding protein
MQAVTSELTLAEVLVKPIRDGNSTARDTYDRMLRTKPFLSVLPINRDILVDAAGLRAATSLKLPDAIHAATALLRGCTTFLTNDAGFEPVPALPVFLVSKLP